jgi:hypothetical protein
MARISPVTLAVIGLSLGLASCSESPSPAAPSPAGASARVVAIDLDGPDTIAPQTSAHFRASARYSNGVALDVTGLAVWSAEAAACPGCQSPSVLSAGPGGVIRALASGEGSVVASYEGIQGSRAVIAVPEGTYRLTGRVTALDSSAPIAGAQVSATPEGGAVLIGGTNGAGEYRLYGASGFTTVLAIKEGYAPRQQHLNVTSHSSQDLLLPPVRPDWGAEKTYVMTIRAAAECPTSGDGALPASARERRYLAAVTQSGDNLFVKLSGAQFATAPANMGGTGGDAFHGVRQRGALTFHITGYWSYYWDHYPYPDVVEQISSAQFLVIGGDLTIAHGATTGILRGSIAVFDGDIRPPPSGSWRMPDGRGECESGQHVFVLEP